MGSCSTSKQKKWNKRRNERCMRSYKIQKLQLSARSDPGLARSKLEQRITSKNETSKRLSGGTNPLTQTHAPFKMSIILSLSLTGTIRV